MIGTEKISIASGKGKLARTEILSQKKKARTEILSTSVHLDMSMDVRRSKWQVKPHGMGQFIGNRCTPSFPRQSRGDVRAVAKAMPCVQHKKTPLVISQLVAVHNNFELNNPSFGGQESKMANLCSTWWWLVISRSIISVHI
jgi:hypothetical protein